MLQLAQRLASHALASTRLGLLEPCLQQAATPSVCNARSLSTGLSRLAQQALAEESRHDDLRAGGHGDKTIEESQAELVHFLHMAGQESKKMWPQGTNFEHCAHKPWSLVCDYMRTTLTSPSMVELWRRQLHNEINFTKELTAQVQEDRNELARVGRLTTTTGARYLIAQWSGPLQESLRKEVGEVREYHNECTTLRVHIHLRFSLASLAWTAKCMANFCAPSSPSSCPSSPSAVRCTSATRACTSHHRTGTLNMLFNKIGDHDAPLGDHSWNARVGHKPGEAKIANLATHLGRLVQVQSHLNNIEEDIQRHQRGRVEYRRAYRQMRALWHGIQRKEPHWPEALCEPGLVEDRDMYQILARVWTDDEPLILPRVADVLIANATAVNAGQQEVVAAAYRTVRVGCHDQVYCITCKHTIAHTHRQVGKMVRRLHAYESRAYWAENSLQGGKSRSTPKQSIEQRGQQQLSSIMYMKQAVQKDIATAAAQYQGSDPQLQDGDFLFWDLRRYMHTHRLQLLRDAMRGMEAGNEHHWAKTVDELFSDVCVYTCLPMMIVMFSMHTCACSIYLSIPILLCTGVCRAPGNPHRAGQPGHQGISLEGCPARQNPQRAPRHGADAQRAQA